MCCAVHRPTLSLIYFTVALMVLLSCLCLLKLYKDSVEETIKENVAIDGQEWDSVSQAEVSSSCAVQEGKNVKGSQTHPISYH